MDWLRLYAEFSTDPKVQMMSEAMQRRLIMLFCLQCSNGIETFHETERETSIAFALRISDDELSQTKALFLRKGFINSDWTLCNWSKRQYVSDSSTARVRKHREKIKQTNETDETLQQRSSNATEQNRTEQNKETTLSSKPDDETRKPQPANTVEAREAIAYLNEKTGSAYRDVKTNLKIIRDRLAEGYTIDDVKAVIDTKCAEWGNDPEMEKYLRPMTLFRPSNFSNYAGRSRPSGSGWWTPLGFKSAFDAENAGFNQHSKREAIA